MKYFSIFIPDPKTGHCGPPTGKLKEDMDRYAAEAIARGQLLGGGGFLSLKQHGAVVRREHGAARVIDGPYAESKELVGGFAMLQYDTRDAAVEGAKRWMDLAGDGECLVYAIAEGHDDCGVDQPATA